MGISWVCPPGSPCGAVAGPTDASFGAMGSGRPGSTPEYFFELELRTVGAVVEQRPWCQQSVSVVVRLHGLPLPVPNALLLVGTTLAAGLALACGSWQVSMHCRGKLTPHHL